MDQYPDIEIYPDCRDVERISAWLGEALGAPVEFSEAGKKKWRAQPSCQEAPLPILLVVEAAGRFSSLWFDSPHTPWARDVDCARAASRALGCEVRCSLGGWQPGDDPDRFFRIGPGGDEGVLHWPDAGA